jgi:phosphinothricin acetyltransferase
VLGWVAVSATSSRPVYRGVVENALYVTERARGRGVGRALLERLIEAADAGDVWTIVAGIFPENTGSLALHESLGFRRVGVRERIGLMPNGPLAGTWRDVVWMERRRPE